MNNTFQQQKQKQLSKLDKSSIGSWDSKIKKLCNKINQKKNYYTTSSCAGRIILLKYSDIKQEDAFLFRTHNKTSFGEIKKALDEGTAVPPYLSGPPVGGLGAGSRLSSLHQNQEFYNTLDPKSQERILFYEQKLSPREVAEKIVTQLQQTTPVEARFPII